MSNSIPVEPALCAIHRAIITARALALSAEDTKRIATLLDEAEYLLSLVLSKEDEIAEFRRILQKLNAAFPDRLGNLLENFDADTTMNAVR